MSNPPTPPDFKVALWQNGYSESQDPLLAVLQEQKEQLAKAERDYALALQQCEPHRARWLAKTIAVIKQRLHKLQAAYDAGQAYIQSMAISLGLTMNCQQKLLKQYRAEAGFYRLLKAYYEERADQLEKQIENLKQANTHEPQPE